MGLIAMVWAASNALARISAVVAVAIPAALRRRPRLHRAGTRAGTVAGDAPLAIVVAEVRDADRRRRRTGDDRGSDLSAEGSDR